VSDLPKSKAEAKAMGALYYFTGKPCKQGHLASKLTSNSGCIECRALEKVKHRDRYIERKRKYRSENLEKCRESVRNWAKKYPERAKQKSRESQIRNWDKIVQYHREWRDKNREKVRAWSNSYNIKNKDKVKKMIKDWGERNPEARRTARLKYVGRKKGADGSFTPHDIKELFLQQKSKCAFCFKNISDKKYHIDHIVPLFRGGSNWRENLQLLCPTCNCSKGRKDPIEWAQSKGRLL